MFPFQFIRADFTNSYIVISYRTYQPLSGTLVGSGPYLLHLQDISIVCALNKKKKTMYKGTQKCHNHVAHRKLDEQQIMTKQTPNIKPQMRKEELQYWNRLKMVNKKRTGCLNHFYSHEPHLFFWCKYKLKIYNYKYM